MFPHSYGSPCDQIVTAVRKAALSPRAASAIRALAAKGRFLGLPARASALSTCNRLNRAKGADRRSTTTHCSKPARRTRPDEAAATPSRAFTDYVDR